MREGHIVDVRFITQDENPGTLDSSWEGRGMQNLAGRIGVSSFKEYWMFGSRKRDEVTGELQRVGVIRLGLYFNKL